MPVGVPQLSFLIPGTKETEDEDDKKNRLSHQRFLFVGDDIDPESANHAVGLITIYGIENKEEIIHCYINSNGGSAIGGLAIFASVTTGIAPVHTICVGTAISMASFILSGGVSTKRLAFPHARVMIHQPVSSYLDGDLGISALDLKQILSIRASVIYGYHATTKQPPWIIAIDLERDVFMTPEEAVAYGIVDVVGFKIEI
uniref:clp protease proteolytic subunit n=1 Tax=Plantago daltonii TaxID=223173 RepID=UPI00315D7CAE